MFDEGLDSRERGGEIVVVDFQAVDPDAFVDALQVRRGVEAGARARSIDDGFKDGGGRAFAVGAGHMGARDRAVRRAHALRHSRDVLQVELLHVGLARRGKLFAQRQKVVNRFLVRHESRSPANGEKQPLCGNPSFGCASHESSKQESLLAPPAPRMSFRLASSSVIGRRFRPRR